MLDLASLVERFGDRPTLALGGLVVGLVFGIFAQHSRFCLRAATVAFGRGRLEDKIAIWALAFSAAVVFTQAAIYWGALDVSEARQLTGRGSLSGAIIGGVLFGAGMVLARGCASRLLVLAGTGNLRAFVTGLLLTIVAQASLRGILSPLRESLSALWVVEGGGARSLLSMIGVGSGVALAVGLVWLAFGGWLAVRTRVAPTRAMAALGVGVAIALGWTFTYAMSQTSFEAVRISSVTFTGPSADTLMALINERAITWSFDTGLVPGVFFGSLLASMASRELVLQGFEGGASMLRYIAGAVLMGFGGMLAGGCAVGAGVTGGAIFAVTAWLALGSMWAGAIATDWLIDRPGVAASPGTSAREVAHKTTAAA